MLVEFTVYLARADLVLLVLTLVTFSHFLVYLLIVFEIISI